MHLCQVFYKLHPSTKRIPFEVFSCCLTPQRLVDCTVNLYDLRLTSAHRLTAPWQVSLVIHASLQWRNGNSLQWLSILVILQAVVSSYLLSSRKEFYLTVDQPQRRCNQKREINPGRWLMGSCRNFYKIKSRDYIHADTSTNLMLFAHQASLRVLSISYLTTSSELPLPISPLLSDPHQPHYPPTSPIKSSLHSPVLPFHSSLLHLIHWWFPIWNLRWIRGMATLVSMIEVGWSRHLGFYDFQDEVIVHLANMILPLVPRPQY